MTNPLKKGALTEDSAGIGTVTSKMVRQRAAELSVIDGRSEQDISRSECEEARRELPGEPETNTKEVALESAPESECWDLALARSSLLEGVWLRKCLRIKDGLAKVCSQFPTLLSP